MQFLKTLFWALLAAVAALFAWVNWNPVTINLWANLQADIKLPVLLVIVFLIGWLPTWLLHRARLWTTNRKIDTYERQRVEATAAAAPMEDSEPAK